MIASSRDSNSEPEAANAAHGSGSKASAPDAYMSWSRVRAYLHCPKAFEFQYVFGFEPEFTAPNLAIGLAVHRVAEIALDRLMQGVSPMNQRDVGDLVGEEFSKCRWSDAGKTQSNFEIAVRCGISLVGELPSVVAGEILAIEESFKTVIWPGLPPVVGRIDLATRNEAGLVLTDFKTTRSAWSEVDVRLHGGQLALYAKLASGVLAPSDHALRLQFVTVSKGKQPVVAVHEVKDPERWTTPIRLQFEQVVRGIEAGVFPARPDRHCLTCAFRARCPHAI